MLFNPGYPNLELMEYKFRQRLSNDEEWKEKREKAKNAMLYGMLNIEAYVFPQTWGSTNTAFDITEDGQAAMGGSAMTKAYTVVMREAITETYCVFVDDKDCYLVKDPTEEFYKDFNAKDMKPLSKAKKLY